MAEQHTQINRQSGTEADSSINFRQLARVCWGLKWWILLCVAVCVGAAYIYSHFVPTVYTANEKIMIAARDNASADLKVLTEITGVSTYSKVINEVEVLHSKTLMQRTVEELGLNYSVSKGKYIKTVLYGASNPFEIRYNGVDCNPMTPKITMAIIPRDTMTFSISEMTCKKESLPVKDSYTFGETISVEGTSLTVSCVNPAALEPGTQYNVSLDSSLAKAKSMVGNLTVTSGKTMDRSDVITLAYKDVSASRAEDVLNCLVSQYNTDARNFSNKAVTNTIAFLDERLSYFEEQLGEIEGKSQNYRKSNTVVDVQSQSQLTLSSDQRYEQQLSDVNLQIELLAIIKDYIGSNDDGFAVIPANIGITDGGLNSTINQYNTLVMERNRLVANSSEASPLVVQADAQLRDLLTSINSSVRNLDKSYKLQKANINAKLREGRQKISDIPTQQLVLSQFDRQQQILEPLYILLQQKREEAMISLFAVTDQCKIIDAATGTAVATAPNRKMIYLLALLLGLCLAPAVFYLKKAFKSTVEDKQDIESRTKIPILASIPMADKPNALIHLSGREPFEESLRFLRSNLRFYDHKVYQVTSSIPGEGKTFIASNLAVSLAHVGKKVLLVGADLRKPRLPEMFPNATVDRQNTLVAFLTGRATSITSIISHVTVDGSTLDIIFAGPVPPNPSELLESERMKYFVEQIRTLNYDLIFLDSAPYLAVADATTIDGYVDANIFVLRNNVADLKFVSDLDQIAEDKKLKNMALVYNGVDIHNRSYGYYGHYYGHYYGKNGYGRGYGYGTGVSGYGYGAQTDKKSKKADKPEDSDKA